jgi:hypothetical protein
MVCSTIFFVFMIQGNLTLWDVRMTRSPESTKKVISEAGPCERIPNLHDGDIWALSFVKRRPNLVISAGEDGVVSLVDIETTLEARPQLQVEDSKLAENSTGVNGFSLSGDKLFVANSCGSISIIHLDVW